MTTTEAMKILGLSSGYTSAELKAAFRRVVKRVHPDVAGPASAEKFKAVKLAYELLLNPGAGPAESGVTKTSSGYTYPSSEKRMTHQNIFTVAWA